MTEEKEKIGVSVRIPQWVLDEIEAEIRTRPRPRPTRGEILTMAWERFKGVVSIATKDDCELLHSGNSQGDNHDSIASTGGSSVDEMLTALIVAGRKSEVDAILRLIRSMFEKGEKKDREGAPLPKTGHADFDRAAEALVHDAEKLRDSESDLPAGRRKYAKRPA